MNEWLQFFPETASKTAVEVNYVSYALFAIAAVFTLGISLTILVFIVRYWHTREVNRDVNHSRTLHWIVEITWMLGPLAILTVMFVWGAMVYIRSHRPPDRPVEINVVAKQWMWKLSHRSGRREINSLHVPIGRPIRLTLISEDVIHSFFVPAFRMKQDVIPGRYTTLWFEANRPGTYHLFCAEYCGTNHSRMIGKVVVMEPGDYSQWIAVENVESLAQAGRRRVESLGCLQCHGFVDGQQKAPSLPGLFGSNVRLASGETVIADAAYLRRSILEPAGQIREGFGNNMPSFEGQIEPEQMFEILAYLRSVDDATGPLAGPGEQRSNTSDLEGGRQ